MLYSSPNSSDIFLFSNESSCPNTVEMICKVIDDQDFSIDESSALGKFVNYLNDTDYDEQK